MAKKKISVGDRGMAWVRPYGHALGAGPEPYRKPALAGTRLW